MFILSLLMVLCWLQEEGVTAQRVCRADTEGAIQLLPDNTELSGTIQYCLRREWRYICSGNRMWTQQSAQVACQSLGYQKQGAVLTSSVQESGLFAELDTSCTGTESSLGECGTVRERDTCDGNITAGVVCQPANCTNGEVRLVGGPTISAGRVLVCVNGRWGTVFPSNTNNTHFSEAVCTHLGFGGLQMYTLRIDTQFEEEPSMPVYRCSIASEMIHCSITANPNTNYEHSNDLGVLCLSSEHTTEGPTSCNCDDITKSINHCTPVNDRDYPTTNTVPLANNSQQPTLEDRNTLALAVVIGVLVITVVGSVLGWACVCVVTAKRKKHLPIQRTEFQRNDSCLHDTDGISTTPQGISDSSYKVTTFFSTNLSACNPVTQPEMSSEFKETGVYTSEDSSRLKGQDDFQHQSNS